MGFWRKFQENISKPLKPVCDPPGTLRIRLCVIWLPVVAAYIPAVYAKKRLKEGIGTVYVDLKRSDSVVGLSAARLLGHKDVWIDDLFQVDRLILDGKKGAAVEFRGRWFKVSPSQIAKFAECSGILGRDFFINAGYEPKVDWMRRELVLTARGGAEALTPIKEQV